MQIKNIKTNNKGITLIALVITIIVLLILAGVAISTLTGDNGILTKAVTAKDKTTEAEAKEAVQLEAIGSIDNTGKFNYEDFKTNVKKNLGIQDKDIKDNGNGTCTVTYKGYDVTVDTTTGEVTTVVKAGQTPPTPPAEDDFGPGVIVAGTENKEYTDDDGETAVIPVGYGIIPGLDDISEGLVITDHFDAEGNSDGNEFVWIPVPTAISDTEANGNTNKAMAVNLGTEANPQYRGLLYDFTDTASTVKSGCTTTEGGTAPYYREPSIVSTCDNDVELNSIGLTQASFQTEMQQAYNDMIKSVNRNKGFYVARYEMSLDASKNAQSKKNVTSTDASQADTNKWYGLYNKAKNFALKTDTSKSVVSSMIWGSQYDAMMNWMHQDSNVNVNSTTPVAGAVRNQDEQKRTGFVETDKIKNVYDLLGNNYEWTLEVRDFDARVDRGGYSYTSYSPAERSLSLPNYGANSEYSDFVYLNYSSTRLTLYIK